ncbi:replication-associated recombination protein A [Candidatus Saccharibacteria bacterium]|nr:replication-associated recombination protein A [Candidatus Saccharibacteria bacterium]
MKENRIPLAERMRPKILDEVVGQSEIIGDGKILTEIVKKGEPVNLIFWGPPGTGKTTLARILAQEFKADFIELSAVTAHKSDVEKVVERAKQNWNLKTRTVLFVDEIHRFNKAQQDAFLPHVESGLITLIGATTENPSFEVISPLLSRSRVVVVAPLKKDDIKTVLTRAIKAEKATKRVTKKAIDYLAELSGGDARSALGDLELALSLSQKIDENIVKEAAGRKVPGYDKKGDNHYDNISAFIKSMRGSDVDATLYYLARMVEAGEDPKFIARRMVIFASEDIGIAGNGALNLAVSAFQAVERVGMPEGGIILSHVAVVLAKCKKNRDTYNGWTQAKALAHNSMGLPVPIHLRNAPTKLMEDLGFGKGQKWEAGFHLDKSYLPDEISGQKLFHDTIDKK